MKTRSELKEEGKALVNGKIAETFWPLLITSIITGALSSIQAALQNSAFITIPTLLIAVLEPIIMYLYLSWNFRYIYTGNTSLNSFFAPFGQFDKCISYWATTWIKEIFIGLWSLLLVVPGIIMTYAYAMTEFILADTDYTFLDAIRLSKNMMKGHKWEYFVLQLSFIGWYILIVLTLGILLIWKGAYINLTFTKYYLNLKEEYEKENPGTFKDLADKKEEETEERFVEAEIFDDSIEAEK